jgi:hypothetical protein
MRMAYNLTALFKHNRAVMTLPPTRSRVLLVDRKQQKPPARGRPAEGVALLGTNTLAKGAAPNSSSMRRGPKRKSAERPAQEPPVVRAPRFSTEPERTSKQEAPGEVYFEILRS